LTGCHGPCQHVYHPSGEIGALTAAMLGFHAEARRTAGAARISRRRWSRP
jgi:hypothetical protein